MESSLTKKCVGCVYTGDCRHDRDAVSEFEYGAECVEGSGYGGAVVPEGGAAVAEGEDCAG